MDPQTISALGSLSGPALMALAILTGARGIWMFGWVHRERMAEKDLAIADLQKREIYYRDMAFRIANIADKAADSRAKETGLHPWKPSSE